jgi:hypothetical protein
METGTKYRYFEKNREYEKVLAKIEVLEDEVYEHVQEMEVPFTIQDVWSGHPEIEKRGGPIGRMERKLSKLYKRKDKLEKEIKNMLKERI